MSRCSFTVSTLSVLTLAIVIPGCRSLNVDQSGSTRWPPASELLGTFEDDYGIRYEISADLWHQHPAARYHVTKWGEGYFIARNDDDNPSEPGLWTRIDWISLDDMEPWEWAFCMTVYDAPSQEAAETSASPDRNSPRTGCNGFPFSRMKRVDPEGGI